MRPHALLLAMLLAGCPGSVETVEGDPVPDAGRLTAYDEFCLAAWPPPTFAWAMPYDTTIAPWLECETAYVSAQPFLCCPWESLP